MTGAVCDARHCHMPAAPGRKLCPFDQSEVDRGVWVARKLPAAGAPPRRPRMAVPPPPRVPPAARRVASVLDLGTVPAAGGDTVLVGDKSVAATLVSEEVLSQPEPLTRAQRAERRRLIDQGYQPEQAERLARRFSRYPS